MSTDTAPTNEIPKLYDPQAAQAQWSAFWEQGGYFNAEPGTGKKPHTIMIPLPNVTGALHMGHALNGTCQDLVTRWKRMQGYEALWMPGTDHAGIATQAVVERRMQEEEGLTRHDIGRDALVTRIWKWKDAYEARIISQLKLLGFSCDWRRTRFTLDDVCSKAVRRTFFKMFQDGYIFRGKRLVNWDCFLQTAVADDEVYDEEIDGHFWTFNYPVVEEGPRAEGLGPRASGEVIRFSTTRPETMLGDTAVCVHPTDERYTHLIGKYVGIPVNGRLIPIIADALLADKTLGTGCVKVTPAHDPNDYACWTRNKEKMGEPINILNPDGTINENGRPASGGHQSSEPAAGSSTPPTYVRGSLDFTGLDRLVAREHVIEEMKRLGHFEGVEDRKIPMKHSDRSKTPIEPYLSEQWFVKMGDYNDRHPGLAQKAIDAVEHGYIKFYPPRYTKTYVDWLMEKRDWCISRQLWWGHRIPIWSKIYTESEKPLRDRISSNIIASYRDVIEYPKKGAVARIVSEQGAERILICVDNGCPEIETELESAGFTQDPDVLDTWFSSALWPHATLGWPDTEHNPPLVERGETRGKSEVPDSSTWTFTLNEDYFAKWPASQLGSGISDFDVAIEQLKSVLWDHKLWKDAESCGFSFAEHPRRVICRSVSQEAAGVFQRIVEEIQRRRENREPLHSKYGLAATYFDDGTKSLSTNEVLHTFYPGNVLITSRDIITLWVARMVLTGLYNMGDIPFSHVHVHSKILDGFGQGMSKSKGNGVDPADLIGKYGADAVRFTIASMAGETQDVRLPIGYECPKCNTLVEPKLYKLEKNTIVVPATLKGQFPVPAGQPKPVMVCTNAKCKTESQFPTPMYDPTPGASMARMVAERFEYGRNFCNKFWNASRFAMLNLTDYTPGPVTADQLQLEDRWILSRLSTVANEMTEYLGRYQFDAATRAIREFTWNEFCDWYLEMIKPRLRRSDKGQVASDKADSPLALGDLALGTSDEVRATAQRILLYVLDSLVRLLQPFTPFICQELWSRLNEIAPTRCRNNEPEASAPGERCTTEAPGADASGSLLTPQAAEPAAIVAAWPVLPRSWQDASLEKRFARLQETIAAVRNVRAIYNIPPTTQLQLLIRASSEVAGEMNNVAAQFDNLAKAVLTAAGADVVRPSASAGFSLGDADGYIPLKGIIDPEAELARQKKEADKIRKHIAGHEGKLANEAFVAKAPADVVAGIRETLTGLKNQLASVEEIIKDLGG